MLYRPSSRPLGRNIFLAFDVILGNNRPAMDPGICRDEPRRP
jgi:hypothetical protein